MRHIISLFLMMLSLGASAQGQFTTHVNEVPGGYNFVLYVPEAVDSLKPLIISLHSRSAVGDNLDSVDRFGTIDALRSGMSLDAAVLAPQATDAEWDAGKIMKDVEWVMSNYDIDPNRIYAIGMSMGGNGVASLAATYPDRIAAAIILAGSLAEGKVGELNKLPLWVIRGLDDRAEAIARTDSMVRAMRSQPDKAPRLVYSRVEGLNHRQHERILYMPYFYQWLLSHSLGNPGRSINVTLDLTMDMLEDSYKGLSLREGSAAARQNIPEHRAPRVRRGHRR